MKLRRARAIALVVVLGTSAAGLAGCGKSTRESSTEPKLGPAGDRSPPATQPGAPAAAPDPSQPRATPRGAERAVYSLVDTRLAAHLTRGGGLVVPAGSAGFAKYVRFNNAPKDKRSWALRQLEGGVKVARLNGKTGTVFVPLTAAQAATGSVRLRMFVDDDSALSLRVNDNRDINAKLAAGWSTVELTVPPGQLRDGENALQLFIKARGAALAWLQVGAKTALADDSALQFYDPADKALVLPAGGQMTWYVLVPERARLTGDLAAGCQVSVLATGEDGATVEGKLAGAGAAVDLAALAGKAARLELEAAGCPRAQLANAALVVPGEPPAIKRGAPPKNVLFVIMDSLRADRVRAFNPRARAEAPQLDKLAETATLFVQHYVQGNESQVSHASMWTAAYLAKHRAAKMADKLPDRWLTIDEVAKRAGKFIAGVSANGYIRPSRGFGGAWDRYINHIEKGGGLRGEDVIEKGMSFITPKKDQPWFLYLGLIDTHVTWRAKQPWLDRYDPGYKGRFAVAFGDDGPGGVAKDLTDREKDHVRALYDANVSYQDDQLGKLRDKLEAWGVWDETMLILTADHGDEQWEDGRVGHAGSQLETLIHVPLLIHYPPLFPAGKIASGTEGVDIVPTLADALGVDADPEWQGASLIPLAHGAVGYPQLATSSQYENFHGGRIGAWKLRLAGVSSPRLYNLARDAGEKRDVYNTADGAIAGRLLLDAMWTLRQWNVEWKKSQWGNAAAVSSRFAADLGE